MDNNKVGETKYNTVGGMLGALARLMSNNAQHISCGVGEFDLVGEVSDNGRMYKVISSWALPLGQMYTCMELLKMIKCALKDLPAGECVRRCFVNVRSLADYSHEMRGDTDCKDEIIIKSKESTINSFFDFVRACNKLEIMVNNFSHIATVWGIDCEQLDKAMRVIMRDLSVKIDNYKRLASITDVNFDADVDAGNDGDKEEA